MMYESFFGFREKPFSLLPDPSFLFRSKIHQEALVLLEYGLHNQAGFTILTGEIGSGKTTLMRYLLETIDSEFTVGLISNTHESLGQLMDWVCAAFQIQAPAGNKLEQHQAFVDFLIQQYALGNRTLLIIDEAQNLSVERLEELRLLSNINADKDFVLQLLLLGQPQLRELLRRPELEQFIQRVSASYHLGRMSSEDTYNYVRHRLKVAGGDKGIFGADACHAVFHYSKGVPRIINLLCDTALVHSYAAGDSAISGRMIDELAKSHASHLLVAFDADERQPLTEREEVAIREALEPCSEVTHAPEAVHAPPEAVHPVTTTMTAPRASMESAKNASLGDEFGKSPQEPQRRPWPIAEPTSVASSVDVEAQDNWRNRISHLIRRPDRKTAPWETPVAIAGAVVAVIWIASWFAPLPSEKTSEEAVSGSSTTLIGSPGTSEGSASVRSELTPTTQPHLTPPSGQDAANQPTTSPNRQDVPATGLGTISGHPGQNSIAADRSPTTATVPSVVVSPDQNSDPVAITRVTPEETSEHNSQQWNPASQDAAPAPSQTGASSSQWVDEVLARLQPLPVSAEEEADGSLRVNLGGSVQFREGHRNIDEASTKVLAQIGEILKSMDDIEITVVGHTDSKGGRDANRILSERRARSVEEFFRKEGIPAQRVRHVGKGESEPRVDESVNAVEGARANRRIELRLTSRPS